MTGIERRQEILRVLEEASAAVNAAALAERCDVTRQIIVADIALLRAAGYAIRSEHRGYIMERSAAGGVTECLVCRHDKAGTQDEFYTIVDNGGKILDVQVEHSLYGQLSGQLSITSRYDADEFMRRAAESNTALLSDLTDGVHIHTVQTPDEAAMERIRTSLRAKGILVEND